VLTLSVRSQTAKRLIGSVGVQFRIPFEVNRTDHQPLSQSDGGRRFHR